MSETKPNRPLLEIDRFSVRFGDKIAVHELSLSPRAASALRSSANRAPARASPRCRSCASSNTPI
jgi:hypothetical protein